MRIGIIGCTKTKAKQPCEAQEMYSGSTLFKLKRLYADQYLDDWMILSSKYGLITKDKVIEPYELCLYKFNNTSIVMNKEHLRGWRAKVGSQILALNSTIVYLVSKEYWTGLPRGETPLLNMRFGTQIKWLKDRVEGK